MPVVALPNANNVTGKRIILDICCGVNSPLSNAVQKLQGDSICWFTPQIIYWTLFALSNYCVYVPQALLRIPVHPHHVVSTADSNYFPMDPQH